MKHKINIWMIPKSEHTPVFQLNARPSNSVHRIECRFEQLRGHAKLFGFLNNFQSIQEAEIREHTAKIQAALTLITIKQSTDGDVVTKKTKDVDG